MARSRALFEGRSDAESDALLAAAYGELRSIAHRLNRGAPTTLRDTVGVHDVLARILGGRVTFRDRSHLVRYGVVALRHLYVEHARAKRARRAREREASVALQAALALEEPVSRPEDVIAVQELLADLRRDRAVPHRREMARAAELCLLVGLSQEDAAEVLARSKATVQARLAAFRAWAQLSHGAPREVVRAHLEALLADASVGRASRIAEAVRLCLVLGLPRAEAAARLRSSERVIDKDVRFFRAWVAMREARRPAGREGADGAGEVTE